MLAVKPPCCFVTASENTQALVVPSSWHMLPMSGSARLSMVHLITVVLLLAHLDMQGNFLNSFIALQCQWAISFEKVCRLHELLAPVYRRSCLNLEEA